jgi:predicted metalloprotease
MPRGAKAGGLGVVGLLVVIALAVLFGADPGELLQVVATSSTTSAPQSPVGPPPTGPGDELADFVSVVLADTEDTWNGIFRANGQVYREPVLVLFSGQVRSACGMASAAMGPFYCPADERVYIDLAFYDDLRRRFGAPGDFAQAYVIAHEVGHHVQNLLGISTEVNRRQQTMGQAAANELSVRLELQADCLAGVWGATAQRTRNLLEAGDLEEAIGAAAAIGDDRLQMQSRGTVVPDAFTHGTSEQRVRWFRRGFETGDPDACDTFSTNRL